MTDGMYDMLREAFWASVDGVLDQTSDEMRQQNHRMSHLHVRHCFEYLRQSLICLVDSNLEIMNYTVRGISDWQNERTCRNYNELVKLPMNEELGEKRRCITSIFKQTSSTKAMS